MSTTGRASPPCVGFQRRIAPRTLIREGSVCFRGCGAAVLGEPTHAHLIFRLIILDPRGQGQQLRCWGRVNEFLGSVSNRVSFF